MSAGPPPVPHRHALSFLGPSPRCLRCGAVVRGVEGWLDAGCEVLLERGPGRLPPLERRYPAKADGEGPV